MDSFYPVQFSYKWNNGGENDVCKRMKAKETEKALDEKELLQPLTNCTPLQDDDTNWLTVTLLLKVEKQIAC